jgi:ribose transport system ATP-binding protein
VGALLQMENLSKSFPGTLALSAVDLRIESGEIHALVGQNGSGKSTLIKILAGFHAPDPGSVVRVDGSQVELGHAAAARDAGFRFVHQDLALVGGLSVVENLALGRGFDTGKAGRIRWRAERARARTMLLSLGFDIDVRRPVAELTAAQRTGVAIARALWEWEGSARVLVLDEPTATLPKAEVEILFESVRRVRERGVGVLYVSHRLDEVFAIADRVTVLRDGRRVATERTDELDEDELISLMLGSAVTRAVGSGARGRGRVILEARELYGAVLDGIDFDVCGGEVVGFAGLTGSGREELLPMLFGARPRHGTIRVGDQVVPPASPQAAIRRGVALVPADRLRQGGVFDMPVSSNLTLTGMRPVRGRSGAISRHAERREVGHWLNKLDVRPPDPDRRLATLSGGNQQKVVIAKWLRLAPKVLLLDELTQGVDVGAKAMIHALIRSAADDGAAVVLASSDDEEICDLCDRVYVLREGRIGAELSQQEMTIDDLGRLQLSRGGTARAGDERREGLVENHR